MFNNGFAIGGGHPERLFLLKEFFFAHEDEI
jgi:hypothetical protein